MDRYTKLVIQKLVGLLIGLVKDYEMGKNAVEFVSDDPNRIYICEIDIEANEMHFYWKDRGKFSEVAYYSDHFTDTIGNDIEEISKIIRNFEE